MWRDGNVALILASINGYQYMAMILKPIVGWLAFPSRSGLGGVTMRRINQ